MEEIIDGGDDGEWQLKITSTFKNAHLIFKLGEEFDETTMDGRKVKVCKLNHAVACKRQLSAKINKYMGFTALSRIFHLYRADR